MKKIEDLQAYELIEKRRIEDLNSESYLLRHKKTGARVALLSNDDENKVFAIGFRTTPTDSTGVAHILEHSVLCGSDKYPVKDPFVELVKGSLNTFLNAMTYADKTVYPLASCNDTDFKNLMDVYLDAVFHPNIYKEEKIFRQEGWHYEMEDENAPLTINGVVYNEMKGAFSSPDEVLQRVMMNSLYPDTTYGVESGGDPKDIPDLTYENFLAFHQKYYHPSNSYIYLYGNMDMAERLDYLDREYLSHYEEKKVDSEVKLQEPFAEIKHVAVEYPIGSDENEAENAYLTYNATVGDTLDRELYIAFQVLDYALCTAPGAPLKRALLEKGIGTDIYSIYENGIKQPYFSIVSKNADEKQEKEFVETVEEVLGKIVKDGFDKKALYAALSHYEFKYREADFGSTPKGLMYGLQMLDSWLYDDAKPFIHVEANATFAALKKKVEEGYFEELVKKYLIENTQKSILLLLPRKGLTEKSDKELEEKLAAYKAGLTKEEIAKIIADSKALKEYQDSEDAEEDLQKIPLLTREDMKKEATKTVNELRSIGNTPFLYHDIFSNGIAYARLIFKLTDLTEEQFPYAALLKDVMGLMDTEHYSYADLFNEMHIETGGMTIVTNVYGSNKDTEKYTATLEVKTKVLEDNMPKAFALMKEMMLHTDFSDKKRLKELLAENKSKMQAQMTDAAHVTAIYRALSGISVTSALNEMLTGITYYRLLEKLDKNFEAESDAVTARLQEVCRIIFRPENLMVDLTGSKKAAEEIISYVDAIKKDLYHVSVKESGFTPVLSKVKEGYKTPGQVLFVCRAGNFRKKGLPYTGTLRALNVMMGYDYLWNQIRVKGGAYGCMCRFGRSGDSYFVSYRDPNLSKTISVYEQAADYIASYEADERTLTQFIIGAISEMDTPMNAASKGLFSLTAYMADLTDEDLQKERDELLATSAEDLRRTAEQVRAFMADECLCVVGNAEKISGEEKLFDKVENLVE